MDDQENVVSLGVEHFDLDFGNCTSSVRIQAKPKRSYGRMAPWLANVEIQSRFDCEDAIHTIPRGAIAAVKGYLATGEQPAGYTVSHLQGQPIKQVVRWFNDCGDAVEWEVPSLCSSAS